MLTPYEVMFETYIQDQLSEKQTIYAPKGIIIRHFVHMAQMIKNDPRPMCIKLIRPEVIWDPFEQKQKTLFNEIKLSNNAMTDAKKEEDQT